VHEVGGRAALHQLAVQAELDLHRVVRAGLVGRDERRAARRGAVERLAGHPLRRLELVVPGGQVVQERVAGHVVHGLALPHVAAAVLDHERHLGLVVDPVAPLGQRHGRARRGQRVAELREERGGLGRLLALLLRVGAVVQADADDLPGAGDRRQQREAVDRHAVVPFQRLDLAEQTALEDRLHRAVGGAGAARGVAPDVVDAAVTQQGGARMAVCFEGYEAHRERHPMRTLL
jgi:hypothetical protein